MRCRREIVEKESLDSKYFCILRKPKEIRASAERGCRACILFKANLKLFDGFEAQMTSYAQASMISASAVVEACLASQRSVDELNRVGSDADDEEVQELKRDRILILIVLQRNLLALIGTMLMPWTPVVFALRHPDGTC
jgi:hypothetical protein